MFPLSFRLSFWKFSETVDRKFDRDLKFQMIFVTFRQWRLKEKDEKQQNKLFETLRPFIGKIRLIKTE
jgi:hypothetical protein